MNAAMEKTSREKIALIVFLILAIGMGCILFGYVFAGHSWNVTASNIDDAFGNMEGYTAIVYEGTIEEEESAAQSPASAASAANGSANSKNAGDAESLPGDSKAGAAKPPPPLHPPPMAIKPLLPLRKTARHLPPPRLPTSRSLLLRVARARIRLLQRAQARRITVLSTKESLPHRNLLLRKAPRPKAS